MKKIGLILILLIATNCYADSFKVPFSCYPKEVQKVFTEYDVKLDLDANERTEGSWGFLENKGTEYWIHTYYPTNTKIREELFFILHKYTELEVEGASLRR